MDDEAGGDVMLDEKKVREAVAHAIVNHTTITVDHEDMDAITAALEEVDE